MKYNIYASLLLATAAPSAWASDSAVGTGTPVVSSSVRADVKDSLPGAMQKATQAIRYPEPSKINIKAMQWCGDSDVAHYAEGNPAWRNMIASQMPFVLGYWVAPVGDSDDYVPTPKNYVALGTGLLPVGGDYVTDFVLASQDAKAKKQDMYIVAQNTIRSLASANSFVMNKGTAGKYRLFLGAMMCHDGGDINSIPVKDQGKYGIAPAALTTSLADEVFRKVQEKAADAVKGKDPTWAQMKTKMRFDLKLLTENSLKNGGLSVEKGDDVSLGGFLADLAEDVRNYDFDFSKTYTDPLEEALQKDLLAKSFGKKLKSLADAMNKEAKTCAEVKGKVTELKDSDWDPEKYAWEPYPLQLTCRALEDGSAGSFAAAVGEFLYPASKKESDFNKHRYELIRRLLQGAQMQRAQFYVSQKISGGDNGWKLPKQRCFDDNKPMINYMMQSLVIKIPEGGTGDYNSSHPEPDFAIGGYDPYGRPQYFDDQGRPKYKEEFADTQKYTAADFGKMSGSEHAVFGMSGADPLVYSLLLDQGNTTDHGDTKYMPSTMRLNFNVRGVGSCLPQYCWNAKPVNETPKHI